MAGRSPERAISDYAMIGGGDCAALVDRCGTLAWLCWPRFDSQAIFASLLGDANEGTKSFEHDARRMIADMVKKGLPRPELTLTGNDLAEKRRRNHVATRSRRARLSPERRSLSHGGHGAGSD